MFEFSVSSVFDCTDGIFQQASSGVVENWENYTMEVINITLSIQQSLDIDLNR